VCTLKACYHGPQFPDTPSRKRRADETCTPGETTQKDCNTCVCTNDGLFACTRRLCLPPLPGTSSRKRRSDSEKPCTKGQTYQKDCNTCHCQEDIGKFVCTLRACYDGPQFPDTEPITTQRPTEPCKMGESYPDDCNTCTCTETGKFACTRRACYHGPQFPDTPVRKRRADDTCTPGERKQVECNTCVCGLNGLFLCTKMGCIPPQAASRKRSVDPKKQCTLIGCYDGPQFSDTIVRKQREVASSTGKYDVPRQDYNNILSYETDRCEPNEVKNKVKIFAFFFLNLKQICKINYFKECNRCKCTKNGKGWMCTRRACPPLNA
jgi:hypothetical protein